MLNRVQLFATPWTTAFQAPLFMDYSKQENWSGLPFPNLGDLPDPEIESASPALALDHMGRHIEQRGGYRSEYFLSYFKKERK